MSLPVILLLILSPIPVVLIRDELVALWRRRDSARYQRWLGGRELGD